MKKTLLTLGVMAAAVCGTLAYAVTRQGSLPTMFSFGTTTSEEAGSGSKGQSKNVKNKLAIDKASMEFAKSKLPSLSRMKAVAEEDTASHDETVENIRANYLGSEEDYVMSDNGTYDNVNNVMQFTPGENGYYLMFGIDAGKGA